MHKFGYFLGLTLGCGLLAWMISQEIRLARSERERLQAEAMYQELTAQNQQIREELTSLREQLSAARIMFGS